MRRSRVVSGVQGLLLAAALLAAPETLLAQPNPPSDDAALARLGIVRGPGFAPGKPSVIIVHGNDPNPDSFTNLATELSRDFNVFYFVYREEMNTPAITGGFGGDIRTFIGGHQTVEDASNQFDDAVNELVRQTGEPSITVVGHSMGGLVARDAMTSDRFTVNTLARGGANALRINFVMVASPVRGINSLHLLPGVGPVVTRLAGVFSEIGDTIAGVVNLRVYFAPISDEDNPFLSGRIGSNVNFCQIITVEENAGDDYVVTEDGQRFEDPNLSPPADNVHRREAGHVGILTDPANARWVAGIVREKAGIRRRTRTRRVSMFNGFGAGGSYRQGSATDMLASFAQDTTTISIDNQVVDTETDTHDLAELNLDQIHEWNLDLTTVDLTVPLGGGGAFEAAADFSFGRADASLVFVDASNTSRTNTYANDGLFGSAGVRGTFAITGVPGLFVDVGYRYERIGALDVMRTPPLSAPGAVVDEVDKMLFRAHALEGLFGFDNGVVSAAGGIRQARRIVELEGNINADFTGSVGFPAVQTVDFVNEFAETTTQVMGRVGVRLGASPVVLHADTSVGGGRSSVRFGVTIR